MRMSARRSSSVSSVESEDNLIDTEVLDSEESEWLVSSDKEGDGELEWLRKDLDKSCSIFTGNKNSLVRRLEHLSKGYSNLSQFSTKPILPISPLCSYLSSKYSPSVNLRNHKADQLAAQFHTGLEAGNQEQFSYKMSSNKTNYRRLAFTSSATSPEKSANKPMNTTFDIDDASDTKNAKKCRFNINVTFDLDDSEDKSKLFLKSKNPSNRNATFEIEEPTLLPTSESDKNRETIETVDNESTEVKSLNRSYIRQITYNVPKHNYFLGNFDPDKKSTKKFEDRQHYRNASSESLANSSSPERMIDDSDCVSNTSTMSDASLGHILEDVQDVQNIARMQEESLKQFGSQGSLPQTLDSSNRSRHLSEDTTDGRGSMPNLNKMRYSARPYSSRIPSCLPKPTFRPRPSSVSRLQVPSNLAQANQSNIPRFTEQKKDSKTGVTFRRRSAYGSLGSTPQERNKIV